jgi:hypothetical protein
MAFKSSGFSGFCSEADLKAILWGAIFEQCFPQSMLDDNLERM